MKKQQNTTGYKECMHQIERGYDVGEVNDHLMSDVPDKQLNDGLVKRWKADGKAD